MNAKIKVLFTYEYMSLLRTASSPLFIIILFLLSLYPFLKAEAQGIGIGLNPATIEESANPGDTLESTIGVTNLSGTPQTYYIFTKDIVGVEGGGVPIFADENEEKTGYELSEWLSLEATEVTLNPGEEKPVKVTVNVPGNATPGSHFGGIFFGLEPPRLRSTGASVAYDVASIVSIRIAGDVVEKAQIRSFSTGNYIYGKPIIDFNARVENKGTVLLRPIGPLEIYNMLGKRVTMMTLNESKAGIFPLSERDFQVVWESEDLRFGRYEAVLSLVYGEQGRQSTISSTASFWVLPMNIVLPALGVLAVVLLIAYVSVKVYINRTVRALSGAGRRIARRRRGGGMSALLLVVVVMLAVTAVFLIVLLALFA